MAHAVPALAAAHEHRRVGSALPRVRRAGADCFSGELRRSIAAAQISRHRSPISPASAVAPSGGCRTRGLKSVMRRRAWWTVAGIVLIAALAAAALVRSRE